MLLEKYRDLESRSFEIHKPVGGYLYIQIISAYIQPDAARETVEIKNKNHRR